MPMLLADPTILPGSQEVDPLARKLGRHVRLSRQELLALGRVQHLNVRTIQSRTCLIESGEIPTEISIVLSGWACRYRMLPGGRRVIVAFYLPGDICDLNVFMMRAMDHSIGAIGTLRVAGLSRSALTSLTRNYPRISRAFWWESLVAGAIQREWTVNLAQKASVRRVAHLLCELFVRMAAAGQVQAGRCAFPLTQSDIADACGVTAIHTNRVLQALRAKAVIRIEDRMLALLDWDALAKLAEFDPLYLQIDDSSCQAPPELGRAAERDEREPFLAEFVTY